jgi:hypothetical protein
MKGGEQCPSGQLLISVISQQWNEIGNCWTYYTVVILSDGMLQKEDNLVKIMSRAHEIHGRVGQLSSRKSRERNSETSGVTRSRRSSPARMFLPSSPLLLFLDEFLCLSLETNLFHIAVKTSQVLYIRDF